MRGLWPASFGSSYVFIRVRLWVVFMRDLPSLRRRICPERRFALVLAHMRWRHTLEVFTSNGNEAGTKSMDLRWLRRRVFCIELSRRKSLSNTSLPNGPRATHELATSAKSCRGAASCNGLEERDGLLSNQMNDYATFNVVSITGSCAIKILNDKTESTARGPHRP